ncbi:hypothetical protein BP00DRAFT_276489 [Aspergillus indologenus CBS 114.80]|uniref:Uncharacterized protein n=1 Tax=Aspergillus indologenus CBS 114.80 TaxID=1450541 RepID=A0A2V5HVX6_9EURO|nr:hypothetical protein BP00DRAFT_276489 [Aspergillus indologenus CBS 114.80]
MVSFLPFFLTQPIPSIWLYVPWTLRAIPATTSFGSRDLCNLHVLPICEMFPAFDGDSGLRRLVAGNLVSTTARHDPCVRLVSYRGSLGSYLEMARHRGCFSCLGLKVVINLRGPHSHILTQCRATCLQALLILARSQLSTYALSDAALGVSLREAAACERSDDRMGACSCWSLPQGRTVNWRVRLNGDYCARHWAMAISSFLFPLRDPGAIPKPEAQFRSLVYAPIPVAGICISSWKHQHKQLSYCSLSRLLTTFDRSALHQGPRHHIFSSLTAQRHRRSCSLRAEELSPGGQVNC